MYNNNQSENIHVFVQKNFPENKLSGSEYLVTCPWCGSSESHPKSLSIDSVSGLFCCNRKDNCGMKGNIYQLKMKLGLIQPRLFKENKPVKIPVLKKEIPSEIKDCGYLLNERLIKSETIQFFRVYVDKINGKPALCFPYFFNSDFVNIKYRFQGKEFSQENGKNPTLWNIDNIQDEELIITEGEIDCMTLWQEGFKNVVSVPAGTGNPNWIQYCWDKLQSFKTIYLAFDNDNSGQTALEEISTRLGKHRCKKLIFGEYKDANDALKAGYTGFKQDLFLSEDISPKKLELPSSIRDLVKEIKNNPDYNKGQKSFIQSLYYKGFSGYKKAEMTLWTGFTGEGKTTFVFNEMVNLMIQGSHICIVSLETMTAKWIQIMIRQILGKSNYSDSEIDKVLDWMDNYMNFINYVGKIEVKELFECFEYSACKYGTSHFVIDNLMKINLDLDKYQGQKDFVNEISNFVNKYKCHVHLIAHQRKPDSHIKYPRPGLYGIMGSSDISNIPDNVITIYRLKNEEIKDLKYDCEVSIQKQRDNSSLFGVNLHYFDEAKSFSEREDELSVNFLSEINKKGGFSR